MTYKKLVPHNKLKLRYGEAKQIVLRAMKRKEIKRKWVTDYDIGRAAWEYRDWSWKSKAERDALRRGKG